MNHAGIYSITSPSGKIYIGQTRCLRKRINEYRRVKCDSQPRIYRSLKKYGFEEHSIRVEMHFTKNVPQEILDYYECAYMDVYKKSGYQLLNIKGGGHNGKVSESTKLKLSLLRKGVKRPQFAGEKNPYYGKKHTDEIRALMSKSNKGKKMGDKNGRARAIYQYDKDMNLIKEWTNITQASKELSIFRQAISDCLNGRIMTSGGFIWKYKS